MDKLGRTILEVACLLLLAVFLFPPFLLGNGQPEWSFIGRRPAVIQWITWDDVLANNFKPAEIHWYFLLMEVVAVAVMAFLVWVSIHEDTHHHGH